MYHSNLGLDTKGDSLPCWIKVDSNTIDLGVGRPETQVYEDILKPLRVNCS